MIWGTTSAALCQERIGVMRGEDEGSGRKKRRERPAQSDEVRKEGTLNIPRNKAKEWIRAFVVSEKEKNKAEKTQRTLENGGLAASSVACMAALVAPPRSGGALVIPR